MVGSDGMALERAMLEIFLEPRTPTLTAPVSQPDRIGRLLYEVAAKLDTPDRIGRSRDTADALSL